MVSQAHSMSAVHCVVVWEWFDDALSKWLPYGPAVSQHLERAHGKQLTRVILSDADPCLVGYYVNLRTQTQCYDRTESTSIECGVRRSCYSVTSPAGRGAKWEWARAPSTRHTVPSVSSHLDQVWDTLPIDLQCVIEEAWSRGDNSVDLGLEQRLACPWVVDFSNLSARGPGGALKNIRRIQQAPYPLTRAPPTPKPNNGVQGRRALTGQKQPPSSNKLGNFNTKSNNHQNISQRPAAKLPREARHSPQRSTNSQPPKDKNKPNLARQILHNLNIFSNKTSPESDTRRDRRRVSDSAAAEERSNAALDADSSSTRSGRRPSVDTISTYLSHESKDSCTQPPVGDLLNCSIGSDDVFEPMDLPPPRPHTPAAGSIVGVDAASRGLGAYVRAVSAAQWGAVCPLCMGRLGGSACGASSGGVVVALVHCSHMLHLSCLNETLTLQQRINKGPLFITCGVCGRAYGGEDNPLSDEELMGNQPPGSMAWTIQPRPPGPPYPPETNTIQITYNISSGVQGAEHPAPGRPYYAVGFPRYTYLPDTPQGRKVLSLIRWAWQRRLVVTVARSATTGREHVAAWAPLVARALQPLQRRVAAAPRRVAALHAALAALRSDNGDDDDEYQELV